jgi:hypothetical protein
MGFDFSKGIEAELAERRYEKRSCPQLRTRLLRCGPDFP